VAVEHKEQQLHRMLSSQQQLSQASSDGSQLLTRSDSDSQKHLSENIFVTSQQSLGTHHPFNQTIHCQSLKVSQSPVAHEQLSQKAVVHQQLSQNTVGAQQHFRRTLGSYQQQHTQSLSSQQFNYDQDGHASQQELYRNVDFDELPNLQCRQPTQTNVHTYRQYHEMTGSQPRSQTPGSQSENQRILGSGHVPRDSIFCSQQSSKASVIEQQKQQTLGSQHLNQQPNGGSGVDGQQQILALAQLLQTQPHLIQLLQSQSFSAQPVAYQRSEEQKHPVGDDVGSTQTQTKQQHLRRKRGCRKVNCQFCNSFPCGVCMPCTHPEKRRRCLRRYV
jgi:hypothetical protein